MRLHGRDLRAGLAGDDVAELHRELRQLGYAIPGDEVRGRFFGAGTQRVVVEFQRAYGLWAGGVVEQTTAATLSRAVAAASDQTTVIWSQPPAGQPPAPPRPTSGPPHPAPPSGQPAGPPPSGPPYPTSGPPYPTSGPPYPTSGPPYPGQPSGPPPSGPPPSGPSSGPPYPAAPPSGPPHAWPPPSGPPPYTGQPPQTGRSPQQSGPPPPPPATREPEPTEDLRLPGPRAAEPPAPAREPDVTEDLRLPPAERPAAEQPTAERPAAEPVADEPVPARPDRSPVTIESTVDDSRPELVRYREAIDRRLGGRRLADVTPAEVPALAEATGIEAGPLATLADAARRAEPDNGAARLPVDVWYAWQRRGIDLETWWRRPLPELVAVAMTAADDGIVPATDEGRLAELVGEHRWEARLDRPARLAGTGDSLRAVLDTMPTRLDRTAQQAVAQALEAAPSGEDMPARLREAGLDERQAAAVTRTLGLADLTGDHAPLVAALQERAGAGVDTSLAPLAKVAPVTWVDMAYRYGAPPDKGTDAQPAYGRALWTEVERKHPTETLRARLSDGSVRINLPGGDELVSYLDRRPDFDILQTPLEPEQREPVHEAVRAVRRLRAVTETWTDVAGLIDAGVTSISDIATRSPQHFTRQVSGTLSMVIATGILSRAVAAQYAATVMLTTTPKYTDSVQAYKNYAGYPYDTSGPPTVQSLFGNQDSCACGHCRSVLSPAAYLVDLLEFLRRDSPAVFSALLARRPDLVDLELSCVNADRELPAIDLALEVMENAVALPLTVPFPPGFDSTAALSANPLPESIMDVLRRTTIDLAPSLRAVSEPQQLHTEYTAWTVTDRWRRWTLHEQVESLMVRVVDYGEWRTPLSPTGIDMAAAVAALDGGQVTADLDQRLRPHLGVGPGIQTAMNITGTQVVTPGERWLISYQATLIVEAEQESVPSLTVTLANGQTLHAGGYSEAAVEGTVRLLDQGEAGGLIGVIIPNSNGANVRKVSGGYELAWETRRVELTRLATEVTVASLTYQSTEDSGDPRAAPVNRNLEAYRILAAADFPWTLPLDLPLAEARLMLDRAGYPRHALLELAAGRTALSDEDIAVEHLGLGPTELSLITTVSQAPEIWARWGIDPQGGIATIWDAAAGEQVTGGPLTLLARVSLLLQQSGLSHGELVATLESRMVRGNTAAMITPLTECRTSEMRLEPLDVPLLDRLHRFTRLRRALGWSIAELDVALAAFAPDGRITTGTLLRFSHLMRLRDRLGLGLTELAAWWGGIGTYSYRAGDAPVHSLYDRLFHDPERRGQPDPDFALNAARTALAVEAGTTVPTLADKAAALAGVWRVPPADLVTLLPVAGGPTARLSLVALGALHRAVTLSRALGLDAADYLRLVRLTGTDPFTDTASALDFGEIVEDVAAGGLDPTELAYLLRHDTVPGLAAVVPDARVAAALVATKSAIAGVPVDDASTVDLRVRRLDAGVTALAAALGLESGQLRYLLETRLTRPGATGAAVETLLDPAFLNGGGAPTATGQPEAFALVRRIAKIVLALTRLGLTDRQARWLGSTTAPGFLALDLDAIPAGLSPADQPVPLTAWRDTVALVRLRDRARGMPAMLERYAGAIAGTGRGTTIALDILAESLGLPSTVVTDLSTSAFTGGGGPRSPRDLARLIDLVTAVTRLGAVPADLPVLLGPAEAAAARAAELLRSRYDAAGWAEVVTPVSDRLRERQRDALVSLLTHRLNLRSAAELYEHFLVDVQTATCMTSTRLLTAVAAVQLFVYRCLLSLEPTAPASAINRGWWDWMKTYRVWEANRKVFLWPQNWARTELLDDASDAIRKMRTALGQEEPSAAGARAALLGYLDDLVDLSQIMVLGLHEERRGSGATAATDLYVVGRTPNPPYRYYWRICQNFGGAGMRWLPWEQVDLDIAGTHVLPFVFGGDLHLAWPVLRKNAAKPPGEWEMQLAWARHTTRGWSEKKISRETVIAPALTLLDERSSFAFRVEIGETVPVVNDGLPPALRKVLTEPEVAIGCYRAEELAMQPGPRNDYAASWSTWAGILIINAEVLWHHKDDTKDIYWPADGAQIFLFGAGLNQGYSLHLKTDANGRANGVIAPFYPIVFQVLVACQGLGSIKTWPSGSAYERNTKVWQPQFILEKPEHVTIPTELVNPDRDVKMVPMGSFVLTARRGVRWQRDRTVPFEKVEDAAPYSSGQREISSRTGDALTLGAPGIGIFGTTGGRFEVIPAGPAPVNTWYYRDNAVAYYLHTLNNGDWLAFTDGYPLAARFRIGAAADLDGLYTVDEQGITDNGELLAASQPITQPVRVPSSSVPQASVTVAGVSFDRRHPYGLYSWELFLHVPMLIADHLSRHRLFAECEWWLRRVIDPTGAGADGASGPERYWRFLPFREEGRPDRIEDMMAWLANPLVTDPSEQDLINQITVWKDNPFRPHAIARMRTGAYQWSALFAYLDNLIAWADDRFRRDTRESLVEAVMLYLQVLKMLGPRPQVVRPTVEPPPLTYRSLAGRWDEFSNAWIGLVDSALILALAQWLQWLAQHGVTGQAGVAGALDELAALATLGQTYFCVPRNEKLIRYWDTVEDRLFKIRHCQNIDGIARQLPLLDPPIDPELLVRAVAAGVDLDSAVASATAPPSPYRFTVLLQKATELCNEVRSLGSALLSALEKRDAERLSQLRSGQEVALLELVGEVRTKQVDEAAANLESLSAARESATSRLRHYQYLLTGSPGSDPAPNSPVSEIPSMLALAAPDTLSGDAQGLGLLQTEQDQLAKLYLAQAFNLASGISNAVAATLFIVGSYFTTTFLQGLGHAANAIGGLLGSLSSDFSHQAGRNSVMAGHQRRRDDWTVQANAALRQVAEVDKQIAAGKIREAITNLELKNHRQQVDDARAADDFLRNKYTNDELYDWMCSELGVVFFGTYQLAFDAARQAERAFQQELVASDTFLRQGYWDSLHKGLMAGDQLARDLRRMEAAYLQRHKREDELTRSVSLLRLDPMALIRLRATGSCTFDLPESFFDADYPGHFMRRLKSVGLSIPAVVGPYTGVHAKLTLVSSTVRTGTLVRQGVPDGYARTTNEADSRFVNDLGGEESIVTSGAVDATGVWEPLLRDDRRLPFEGRGAISSWRLTLPGPYRAFDYRTIADVVLHLRYSARDAGGALATAATTSLARVIADAALDPPAQLISLRQEYPTEWARLTSAETATASQVFPVTTDRFPYLFNGRTLTVKRVDALLGSTEPVGLPSLRIGTTTVNLTAGSAVGPLAAANATSLNLPVVRDAAQAGAAWTVSAPADQARLWEDLVFVVTYQVTG